MKIQVLDSTVVAQIAAGEVLERPANLVKELVENSLDAGATEVTVDLSAGGRNVRIKDNGRGISAGELSLALARHATSKLVGSGDLWTLSTFGFRGEALASISSVSRTTVVSRTPEATIASKIHSTFGAVSDETPVSGEPGTTVTVEELFSNVPARLKFLKSENAEIAQIRKTIKALALAHPSTGFKVRVDQKLVHHYPVAQSRKERVEQILPEFEFFESSAEVSGFEVEAIFTSPKQTFGNSQNIWLFAQDRWIQDRALQAAVMEAYRSLLMHHEYPVAVVFLKCSPEEIDVNIHPTKAQVKFRDPASAFKAVQRALRAGLENAPWVRSMSERAPIELLAPRFELETHQTQLNIATVDQTQYRAKSFEMREPERQFLVSTKENSEEKSVVATRASSIERSNESQFLNSSIKSFWSDLEVLAQAHLTYIVAQSRSSIFFVDQHAAHERIVFEKLMSSWKSGAFEIQDFLIPLQLFFSGEQIEALMTQSKALEHLGLTVEQLGDTTLLVRSAPALIQERSIASTLEKLANEILDRGGSFAFERKIGDICASMACHSVVRAGQALSVEECRNLLRQMDEFPLSGFCPHGRPVYVEYPISKLDRDFGRIV